METSKNWPPILELWRRDKKGPWSLPFLLARHYLRFLAVAYPELRAQEKSMSGKRQFWDLPDTESMHFDSKWITDPVLDAFSSLTNRLPPDIQLVYQLHLEGLLEEEISHVLRMPVDQIPQLIQQAKQLLGVALAEGKAS